MANKQVIFSDRIVGLSLQNGLVRVELAVVAGAAKTKDGKDGVKMDITHQLVMPLEAFVAGVSMQQDLVKELISRQQDRNQKAAELAAPVEPAASTAK